MWTCSTYTHGSSPATPECVEHTGRDIRVVVVPVKPLVGREIDRERVVEHDGRRREARTRQRITRAREPAAGGDDDGDPARLELRPRGRRRRMDLLVHPQRAVEISDDELDHSSDPTGTSRCGSRRYRDPISPSGEIDASDFGVRDPTRGDEDRHRAARRRRGHVVCPGRSQTAAPSSSAVGPISATSVSYASRSTL